MRIIVLAILAAAVAARGAELTEQVRDGSKDAERIEASMLTTNAAYMTPAQLKAEWAAANNDTKKLAVLGKWITSEDAKDKAQKAAKKKVKKDKAEKDAKKAEK